jgi:hypothetical protein
MPDLRHRNRLRAFYARHRESEATLGIAMALIAMLFIAGIVTAFIHAADTGAVKNAQTSTTPPVQTTGSGSAGR